MKLSVFNFSCGCNAEAVPKKILELMNVEKLNRENVASHLQALILNFPDYDPKLTRRLTISFCDCRNIGFT